MAVNFASYEEKLEHDLEKQKEEKKHLQSVLWQRKRTIESLCVALTRVHNMCKNNEEIQKYIEGVLLRLDIRRGRQMNENVARRQLFDGGVK